MNPFFFGSGERRLFGLYTPGHGGGAGGRAAVLCHPWGQEYLRAHRSVCHLAGLLTRAGVHALRFDYFGTGDSAGEPTDADLASWEEDIEGALEELKDTSGVAQVGLVGLRLGATLAAAVAARRPDDVERLVLWDPVVDGAEYLGELRRAASPERGPGEPLAVDGFPLTDALAEGLGALDLPALVPSLPPRTLVVASAPLPSHGALRSALDAAPQPIPFEELPSPPAWIEERSTGVGALPVNVLQRIVQWWGVT